MAEISNIVDAKWLAKHINDPDIRILDASWHMPAAARDARVEFEADHIAGAQYFDIDDISNNLSELPHMVPTVEKFTSRTRKLGVADGTRVVIYDSVGIFSAPRAWWMFKLFGKENVAVLDGGLPKWKSEGHPTTQQIRAPKDRHLTLNKQPMLVKTVSQVAEASKMRTAIIMDARPADRFAGAVAEPRQGLRAGHIPGAINLPFHQVLNADGTMKSPPELRKIFDKIGVDGTHPIITSCGSGITASILALAIAQAGFSNCAVYDGSWTEWGSMPMLPIETGADRSGSPT